MSNEIIIPPPMETRSQALARAATPTTIPNPVPGLAFLGILGAGISVFWPSLPAVGGAIGMAASGLLAAFVAASIKVAAQWEKALVFRLGRFAATKGPGLFLIIPGLDAVRAVDTRIQTIDIPHRQAITKDNVPVRVDGVIFMRVSDPGAAVTRVQNYTRAVLEYAQTALRDIVGSMTLDEILADRELLGQRVEDMVTHEIEGWGLDVAAIRIQDIELPEDLKRVMARQASAEREKRATITKAEGDREAAENLAAAAQKMAASPGALQLRTLQSLDSLGSSPSNTIVLAVPVELTNALSAVPKLAEALKPAASEERGSS
ncbi:MAG: SPFH domain-containing protein [Fimbriimonadaceae bacterium]|nr:SPFH domain-containing protein [Fimbriimonadaceae bacterium]QYK57538.1 MAG: SPFH domain-containing protein [Fimbriimonadaceae bacterium]